MRAVLGLDKGVPSFSSLVAQDWPRANVKRRTQDGGDRLEAGDLRRCILVRTLALYCTAFNYDAFSGLTFFKAPRFPPRPPRATCVFRCFV